MKMNKSRSITLEKYQQLSSHEISHHFQFCLLHNIWTIFPEFQIYIEPSPLDWILEECSD